MAGMEKLNVDQPGPSTSRWDSQKSPGSSHSTEKENTNIGGFQILKMNSAFITSFTAGYELPCQGLRERFTKRVHKCCYIKRRRLRTHPYDNSNSSVITNTSSSSGYSSGAYRLRTTSLSSGTSKNKSGGSCNNALSIGSGSSSNSGSNSCSNSTKPVLIRSRSMENLSATMGEGLIISPKPKELETVSKGIQQLKMDDCT